MSDFIEKKIIAENNLGEVIKKEREEKGLKIKKLSRKLNIRKEYLLAIEANRLDLLPDGIYGKKFFKKYANFLSLNQDLINEGLDELSLKRNENPFSTKTAKKKDFLVFPKIARNIILILIVLACALYLSLYAKKIFSPPEMTITYPENNLSTTENSVTIKGSVEKVAEIKIYDELVLADMDGNFEKEVNLKKGANNIVISAKKKYGQEEIINRYILVE
jgi:cytoskeletal protein RodZ